MYSLREDLGKELEVIDFMSEKLYMYQGNPRFLDRTGSTELNNLVIRCAGATRDHVHASLGSED